MTRPDVSQNFWNVLTGFCLVKEPEKSELIRSHKIGRIVLTLQPPGYNSSQDVSGSQSSVSSLSCVESDCVWSLDSVNVVLTVSDSERCVEDSV